MWNVINLCYVWLLRVFITKTPMELLIVHLKINF